MGYQYPSAPPPLPPGPGGPFPPAAYPPIPYPYPYVYSQSAVAAPPPRVWTTFVAFIIALATVIGIQLVFLKILWIYFVPHQHGEPLDWHRIAEALTRVIRRPIFLVTLLVANQATFAIVTACAAFLSPVPARRRLGLMPSTMSLTGYGVAAAGALAIGYGFEFLVALLHVKPTENLKLIGDLIEHLSLAQILLGVFIIGVLPGIFEELLFRGYMQTRLEEAWGRWSGILIAAPLFGAMHMDPVQSPFAYAFGVYLGYVASKAGSIRPTMFCHMVNNGVQVFFAWSVQRALARHPAATHVEQPSSLAAAFMLAICCLVVTLSVLYVKFLVPPPRQSSGFPHGAETGLR